MNKLTTKKVLIVFGTRPEAIKMIPIIYAFNKNKNDFNIVVCVTGQHRKLLNQVLELYNVIPDFDLNIMEENQTLENLTSSILLSMKSILTKVKPDIVLVHGDTTTAMATSLASYYQKIPIAHIEAGLRTKNMLSPWPEEGNRHIIGVLAKYHLTPTEETYKNLIAENKDINNITITGNTAIDMLFLTIKKIKESKILQENIISRLNIQGYKIQKEKQIILITGHRREQFGVSFHNICNAIKDIALKNPTMDFIYAIHPNPNVYKPVHNLLKNISNIYLIDALDYDIFIYLMQNSYFIITDSGGIQEEASTLGIPVLLTRTSTDRPEVLNISSKLIGVDKLNVIKEVQLLIDCQKKHESMSKKSIFYGNGNSSQQIVHFLKKKLLQEKV